MSSNRLRPSAIARNARASRNWASACTRSAAFSGDSDSPLIAGIVPWAAILLRTVSTLTIM
jgi:predicted protein tyrosine phosphatase